MDTFHTVYVLNKLHDLIKQQKKRFIYIQDGKYSYNLWFEIPRTIHFPQNDTTSEEKDLSCKFAYLIFDILWINGRLLTTRFV